MNKYNDLVENLKIIGIPPVSPDDIQRYGDLLELLKSKADSFDDLGSDFRISMSGSTLNIGKRVIELLSNQYQSLKEG